MTRKEYQHLQYTKRRERLGADHFRKKNQESYERNREKTLSRQREHYRNNADKINARVKAYHKRRPEILKKAQEAFIKRHPEKPKEYARRFREKHGNANQIKYYWRHRDAIREKLNQRRFDNRLYWRAYYRDWTDKNREKINSRRRAIRNENVDKYRSKEVISASKRRAIKKSSEINPKSIKIFILRARQSRRVVCFWCKEVIRGKDCHIDHIIALSKGGRHSVENLCVSCESCNLKKGGKSLQDWNLAKPDPQLVMI